MSVSNEKLLLLKNATVNRNLGFDAVCKEKYALVAYINDFAFIRVNNITGEMRKSPVAPYVSFLNIAWEWEIQAAFFKYNNIKPQWINANQTFGTLNESTGHWSGAVGLIQRDEADYACCSFSGTYPRSKVASFSSGPDYLPYYWLTRYPKELSPAWNLFRLFTKVLNAQISNYQHKRYQSVKKTTFFLLVCLDVDILLHIICFFVVNNVFNVLSNYVSKDKIIFN